MKSFLFFIFYFFINDGLKAEVGFVPSLDISIYGGKYYIDGESSSMDLKTDIFGSYVINFDEENQLYPIYSGYYNGTQDITE
ncbi:MAG: hypothetical protein N2Z60_06460, partial [Elusimicrobiales bacterium]|nr:hypothetical protein [Elusimicrobiales bacterium]